MSFEERFQLLFETKEPSNCFHACLFVHNLVSSPELDIISEHGKIRYVESEEFHLVLGKHFSKVAVSQKLEKGDVICFC